MYHSTLEGYYHYSVFHGKKEWVNGKVHINNMENFWSVLKRGIYGIYHQVSFKHVSRYCDEFAYRYNSRKMKDAARFELTLGRIERRLSYKMLVYGQENGQKTQTEKA